MPDGAGARQTIQTLLIESLRHVPHVTLRKQLLAVRRNDAAGFLAAVLQGVQTQVGQARCFGMSVDPEYAAFFVQLVIPNISHGLRLSRLSVAFNQAAPSVLFQFQFSRLRTTEDTEKKLEPNRDPGDFIVALLRVLCG
jgi:hypothetical protein